MTTQAGGVRVRIFGDDSDLKKTLKDSANELAKWGVAAAAAAAAGAVAVTKNTAAAAKEVDNLSRLTGQSVVEFQRQAAAAKSVGIEQDKLADIYKDSSDKLGDFMQTGAGPLVDFFEQVAPKIGVTADEFRDLTGPQVLQKYVSGLEKANLSQSEMTFYMEAIASDATLLLPLLEDNGKKFEELGDRAEKAGAVLSEIDVAKMGMLAESMAAGQEVVKGLTNQIALQLAPVLQGLGDLFGENGDKADEMKVAVEKAFGFIIKGSGFVADSVRGIQVIIKGLEAGFWALSAVTAEIFEQMARGVDDFVVKPALTSINALIDGVNMLPGIDLDRLVVGDSAAVTKLTEISDAATANMKEVGTELHDLMMQPLPSKALEDFVALAQAKSEEAAKAIVEIKNNAGLVVPVIDPSDDPEVIAEKNKLDAMLAAYQDYGALRVKSGEDFRKTDVQKAEAFAESMKKIDADRFDNQLAGASHFFGNLSSLMDTESRSLFAIGKAAAIAQATVDGIAAAVSSFKFGASIGGPILGGVFAASSAVATGAQIASLAATSFGGGGGQASAPSVSVPSMAEAPTGSSATGGAGTGAGQNSTLTVEGLDPQTIMDGASVRGLAEKLLNYQRDGGEVVLT